MTEETLFAAALEQSGPAEREAYLDAACAGDAALRRRVEALLRAHEAAGPFLEKPIPGLPAEAVEEPPREAAGTDPSGPGACADPTLPVEGAAAPGTAAGDLPRPFGDYELLEEIDYWVDDARP
jgi:hypothetical protein